MKASRTKTIAPSVEFAVVATEHYASSGEYRFSAAAKDFPGSFSFGATSAEAMRRCQAVVLRLLAERTCPLSARSAYHAFPSTTQPPNFSSSSFPRVAPEGTGPVVNIGR